MEDGQLVATSFTGWAAPILLHPDASPPRLAQALPRLFDPEARNRDRAERRFDFRYRLEIYVPLAKRVFGDYVLPPLFGGNLVAGVGLKADRSTGRLLV